MLLEARIVYDDQLLPAAVSFRVGGRSTLLNAHLNIRLIFVFLVTASKFGLLLKIYPPYRKIICHVETMKLFFVNRINVSNNFFVGATAK